MTSRRVIALAHKKITDVMTSEEILERDRAWVESDLEFVGFIAFTCLVRQDSADVIADLKASSHRVAMITGN